MIAVGSDGHPRAINACLRLLCGCDGLALTTVEGLGSHGAGYSQVMKAIAEGQGSRSYASEVAESDDEAEEGLC